MSKNTITAVLVLYRERVEDSACFCSLREILADEASKAEQLHLLLYDNSPLSQPVPDFPSSLNYVSDPQNGGVAAAYSAGLEEARRIGSSWLLLLDQDTVLTREYLNEVHETIDSVRQDIVVIVPRLVQDGQTHSPQKLPRLSHHPLPEALSGELPVEVSAFNSGAVVRVAALRSFPARYWLDFLDHAVFHELQANNGRVWLLRARLQHRLSTERLGQHATLERYMNMLQAERDFYQEYASGADRTFYHLRRAKQTVGQLLKVSDKRFALLSARAALGLLPPTPLRTH